MSDWLTADEGAAGCTLLDEVLNGIRRGEIAVRTPSGRGVGPTAIGNVFQDLDEASELMAFVSEFAHSRGHRPIPARPI